MFPSMRQMAPAIPDDHNRVEQTNNEMMILAATPSIPAFTRVKTTNHSIGVGIARLMPRSTAPLFFVIAFVDNDSPTSLGWIFSEIDFV